MGLYRRKEPFRDSTFEYVLEVDFQIQAFAQYINLTEKIIENEEKD